MDPTRAFGQPLLVHGGARVEDLVDRFKAGDGFADIAADFDVPSAESRTSSGLPSASRPEFFIDRSLGGHIVPDALREAGAVVHVMAELYGERIGQGLPDTDWLRDAGDYGWVVLMKDDRIRYRPAELQAVTASAIRAFCPHERQSAGRGDGPTSRRAAPENQPDSH